MRPAEYGAPWRGRKDGTLLQFRCHIGHQLSAETMRAGRFDVLEAKLTASVLPRSMCVELCREMSEAALAG
jgi:hypothetical protein